MITFKRLKWDNCFSYGESNYIDLDQYTLTQIIGPNGAGKSSIPLIIEEVLFSKNSKGVKKADIPNRNTGKDAYNISLAFDIDSVEYELTVNRKSTIKVKLVENGVDISSHTATNTFKSVLDLMGIDFKTMSQLFYQNTNASLQFLTATDTNRKKFLIDLLRLEDYVALFEVFKEAVKEISNKVSGAQATVNTVQKWLDGNKIETTTVLPLLEIDLNTEEDEIALRKVSLEFQNIANENRKVSINEDYKARLAKIPLDEAKAIDIAAHQDYDSDMATLGAKKQEGTSVSKYINKLESLGDTCPTCEQKILPEFKGTLLADSKATLGVIKAEVASIEERIATIKVNNTQYAKKLAIQKDWEDTYRNIDENLPNTLQDKQAYQNSIDEITKRIDATKAAIATATYENNKRMQENARNEVIQEQTAKFKLQLEEASATLLAETNRLAEVEILKKSFSTNGLIAYKIENLVKDLEDYTNEYLAELSDGRFTIQFVVSNDKLNVEVTDFNNVVDILALSSGELARVNTSTLLALRKLMGATSKSNINVLFLDEVINVLDEQGKERLVEVLLEEKLNIFIVSHNWTHPLLEKLVVVKDSKGISYIER
jgi:DNA repair exonuclease SbcCD ATPase subunit